MNVSSFLSYPHWKLVNCRIPINWAYMCPFPWHWQLGEQTAIICGHSRPPLKCFTKLCSLLSSLWQKPHLEHQYLSEQWHWPQWGPTAVPNQKWLAPPAVLNIVWDLAILRLLMRLCSVVLSGKVLRKSPEVLKHWENQQLLQRLPTSHHNAVLDLNKVGEKYFSHLLCDIMS